MNSHDTVSLLGECDAGAQMGVSAMDEVLARKMDGDLRALIERSRSVHGNLGAKAADALARHNSDGKAPNPIAEGMSWLKTNVSLAMDASERVIASLLTDGCAMGIKSLGGYLNKYSNADSEAKAIANELIAEEENLSKSLRKYL